MSLAKTQRPPRETHPPSFLCALGVLGERTGFGCGRRPRWVLRTTTCWNLVFLRKFWLRPSEARPRWALRVLRGFTMVRLFRAQKKGGGPCGLRPASPGSGAAPSDRGVRSAPRPRPTSPAPRSPAVLSILLHQNQRPRHPSGAGQAQTPGVASLNHRPARMTTLLVVQLSTFSARPSPCGTSHHPE